MIYKSVKLPLLKRKNKFPDYSSIHGIEYKEQRMISFSERSIWSTHYNLGNPCTADRCRGCGIDFLPKGGAMLYKGMLHDNARYSVIDRIMFKNMGYCTHKNTIQTVNTQGYVTCEKCNEYNQFLNKYISLYEQNGLKKIAVTSVIAQAPRGCDRDFIECLLINHLTKKINNH